jgi:hypothetical protein
MNLREAEWEVLDWIYLVRDRGLMVSCCENGHEFLGSIKYKELLECLSVSLLLKKDSLPWS